MRLKEAWMRFGIVTGTMQACIIKRHKQAGLGEKGELSEMDMPNKQVASTSDVG